MKQRGKIILSAGFLLCCLLPGSMLRGHAVIIGGQSGVIETTNAPSAEQTEIIVDVREGRFISGPHERLLSQEAERPITLSVRADVIYAQISTDAGMEALELGRGHLAVTQEAVPFVSVEDASTHEITGWEEGPVCEVCKRPTAIGKHYLLDCGHYGCLMTADHPERCTECGAYRCNGQSHALCAHCDVAFCMHVDLECEYTRNPAPTPFSTMVPEEGEDEEDAKEKEVYYMEDPSGHYRAGDPALAEATRVPKNYGWTPGLDAEEKEPQETS